MKLYTFIFISLLFLIFNCQAHYLVEDEESNEQSIENIENRLVSTRKALIAKLDGCSIWREKLDDDRRDLLERMFFKGHFEKFRELAIKIAKADHPEDEDCLKSSQFLIKKYTRLLNAKKRQLAIENTVHLEEFLSIRQINLLHDHFKNGANKGEIEMLLRRHFDGLTENQKSKLLQEFFEYKTNLRRKTRRLHKREEEQEVDLEPTIVIAPEELSPDWLLWQTARHKLAIEKLKQQKADQWELMNTLGVQFYHLRKEIRVKYERNLQSYCASNLIKLLGKSNLDILGGMYQDNDPVDHIETKFHEMVADLPNEKNRLLADHYGSFCRKIFRLVHFEPTDLTGWLTNEQKSVLGRLIINPDIDDLQVYQKVFEFFNEASGEQKEEARDTIDTGCRHFIAHMFGDDTAEELEDLRVQGNIPTQRLAARLVKHSKEIKSERLRKRAESSLPMCVRIYLGFNSECECYDHANICDAASFNCVDCQHNTFGVQCEMCIEGYSGNATSSIGCYLQNELTEEENQENECNCNQHADSCDADGKCQSCLHNTFGDQCDQCVSGFYGDAVKGTAEDCSPCPCPNSGDCVINEAGLVQCLKCPEGRTGITCEELVSQKKDSREDNKSSESNE